MPALQLKTGRSRTYFVRAHALPGVGAAGLVGLTLLAYVRFLGVGFAATDSLPLVETSRLSSPADAALQFTRPLMAGTTFALGEVVYRPFVAVTFGLDYALWGLDAMGYHLTNLGLHVVAVLSLWFLLTRLGLRIWSSLAGSALFALHPLVVASVPVIARRDSVAPVTAFLAGAGLLLVAERARGIPRALTVTGSLLLVAIALLSKESAFAAVLMLPMVFLSTSVSRADGLTQTLRRSLILVPYLILTLAVFAVRAAVLGQLGGPSDPATLMDIDPDRYSQILGAFTRDLAWAFAWIAPSTREIWPRVAAVCLVGLALTIVWLPRKQAAIAAAGTLWIVGFVVFSMALKITTIAWLAYFALVGVAMVFAAGLEGALVRIREAFSTTGWRSRVARLMSLALLAALTLYAASALSASALLRDYYQWQVAGDVTRLFTQALAACVADAPYASRVSLRAVPMTLEDGRFETDLMGVTLLEDYTVHSALRLAFPGRTFTVDVKSWETLRTGADSLRFSCAKLPPDGVELTTTY